MKQWFFALIGVSLLAGQALAVGQALAASQALADSHSDGATLTQVKAKGFIHCGVSEGTPGLSNADDNGNWSGLDVDVCRAVAAAVFGDANAVRYTPLSAKSRFSALSSGGVDILSRNTTWTMTRDTQLGLHFAGVNYYDGQGVIVRRSLGASSINDLDGANICANAGSTSELDITDYFRANAMRFTIITFEKADETIAAYDSGRCDVFTTDRSALAANRGKLTDPDAHVVLPETISKEPLGPSVRQGDDQWFNIVRWSLNAMINAEELGVNSGNVAEMLASSNPAVQRLLGVEGNFGVELGLSNDWARNIIAQVGNYGESYERHVGEDTPIGLSRGINNLWNNGGILYAPPIR